MAIFGDPDFRPCKEWIESRRYLNGEQNKTWEELDFALRKNDDRLQAFLDDQAECEDWPHVTIEEWHESIRLMRDAERNQPPANWGGRGRIDGEEQGEDGRTVRPSDILNHYTVPNNPHSAWQLYHR